MRLYPLALLLSALPAQAVIVRGTVTGPFGQPVPGARIQLIALSAGTRSLADTVSGVDGTYEIRTDLSGRFLLLTTTPYFAPQVGTAFYAGRTDLVNRDIALDPASLTPLLTTLPNNLEAHPAQLSTPITQIPADHLLTRALIPKNSPKPRQPSSSRPASKANPQLFTSAEPTPTHSPSPWMAHRPNP